MITWHIKAIEMREQQFVMPHLPDEIWELIFTYCEVKLQCSSLPLVSKLFRNILHDNGGFWQRECARKNLDLTSKPESKSWKQFHRRKRSNDDYWNSFQFLIIILDNIRLFPVFGLTIRRSTFEQLRNSRLVTSYDEKIKCVTIDGKFLVFCRLSENGRYHCVSSISGLRRTLPMPE